MESIIESVTQSSDDETGELIHSSSEHDDSCHDKDYDDHKERRSRAETRSGAKRPSSSAESPSRSVRRATKKKRVEPSPGPASQVEEGATTVEGPRPSGPVAKKGPGGRPLGPRKTHIVHRAARKCDRCGKQVKNLPRHMRAVHKLADLEAKNIGYANPETFGRMPLVKHTYHACPVSGCDRKVAVVTDHLVKFHRMARGSEEHRAMCKKGAKLFHAAKYDHPEEEDMEIGFQPSPSQSPGGSRSPSPTPSDRAGLLRSHTDQGRMRGTYADYILRFTICLYVMLYARP